MKTSLLFLVLSMLLSACGVEATSTPDEVTRVIVVTPTPEPTTQPTIEIRTHVSPTAATGNNQPQVFAVRSVDVMKLSQDMLRNPLADEHMAQLVEAAKPLNLTHMAISVPYDEPPDLQPGSAVKFTRRWVSAIRDGGMNVWHRPSFIAFKGFYDAEVNPDVSVYIPSIIAYIETNPDLFAAGDIFTPTPEPGNGRVRGVNCSQNCLFDSIAELADWTSQANRAAEAAFASIGLGGQVIVGLYGHDGFLVWGDRNPDHEGKPATLANGQLLIAADHGRLCIDHYFGEADPAAEFQKIRGYFPEAEIWICEWGPVNDQPPAYTDQLLAAAEAAGIIGFNWWQSGPDGIGERLVTLDANGQLVSTDHYEVLKKHFNP